MISYIFATINQHEIKQINKKNETILFFKKIFNITIRL